MISLTVSIVRPVCNQPSLPLISPHRPKISPYRLQIITPRPRAPIQITEISEIRPLCDDQILSDTTPLPSPWMYGNSPLCS